MSIFLDQVIEDLNAGTSETSDKDTEEKDSPYSLYLTKYI
jgi:hypothetical protein